MEVQDVFIALPCMTFVVFCELFKLPSLSSKERVQKPCRWLFQLADDSIFCYLEHLS